MHWNLQQKKALGTRATNVVVVASLVVLAPHQAVPSKSVTSVTSFTSAKCIAGIAACTVHALGGTTWPGFLIKRPNNSCRFAESTCSPVRRSTEFSRPCRSCHSFHSQNSPDDTNLAAIHLFAHVNISPDFNLKIWLGQNHTLLFADQINNSISATWLCQSLRAQLIPPKPEPHLPAMSTGLCRNFPRNSSAEYLLTDFSFSYVHHLYPRNLQQDPLKNHP